MTAKWQFDLKNLMALGRASLIYLSPLLIAILTKLQSGEQLDLTMIYMMAISILIDALRRINTDYTK